ncbi:MAG: tetratricopeptide repeat protein [Ectothiorhodospiraceae bacterium]|nr:tetratricopeptide repeat protein [Ectothiorhodospiraceae bacterium]
MTDRDALNNPVTGADEQALAQYAQALREFHCYRDDPVATITGALERRPDFVMGHGLHGWRHALGTEPEGMRAATGIIAEAERLRPNRREQAHCAAIKAFAGGRWREASRRLEDLTIDYPLDALALQAGHLTDFYRGDARMLRDRPARALAQWEEGAPGFHAVLAMHAFGLEEAGSYRQAELQGKRALEADAEDSWAHHAVVHVMEMEGRGREGIDWIRGREPYWARDNFFAVHNWWHLALMHLDQGDVEEVLALFDGPIHGERSTIALDLVDASALLWRLKLRGVDAGARWSTLAELWDQVGEPGQYSFNDFHAMMAWVGAGDEERAGRWQAAQSLGEPDTTGDHADISRNVGEPLLSALSAFAKGDYARVIALLREVRPIAHQFGGSHAQRDLIDLTLLEAARRNGDRPLARALTAERMAVKPTSLFNQALEREMTA